MELNHNCIRSVLLKLESYPYNYQCTMKQLSSDLPDYENEDIQYCVSKLHEIGYIDANVIHVDGSVPLVTSIYDITFAGHEFLNSIREPELWEKTKSVASKIGATSISALTQISSGVITALIKSTLGI